MYRRAVATSIRSPSHLEPLLTPTLLGIAAGLGSSLAWALANVFIQKASRVAGSVTPLLWGQLVGSAVLLLALPWFPAPDQVVPWAWLGVGAVASAVAYLFLFRAFAGGPVSVVSPVVSSWALLSAALGVALFGETLSPLRGLGGLLVVGGALGIAARTRDASSEWRSPRAGVLASSVASAVGFGVMVAAVGPVTRALGPVLTIVSLWAGQWVVSGAFLLPGQDLRPPRAVLGAVAALGLLEATGFLCLEVGSTLAPLVVVAPAASLSSLFTVLLGRVWLGEAMGWDRVALTAVVVTGVSILAVS